MKKLLLILLSVILFGCSENRVLIDELTNKGTKESPLMFYESGLFNGIAYDVYENGQLRNELNFKDGKKDGKYTSYYENGQVKQEGNFKDGKQDGKWIYYHSNGKPMGKGNFLNGDSSNFGSTGIPKNGRDGIWIFYYENGQVEVEGNFKDGKEDGKFTWHYENGQLEQERNFKDGTADGKFTSYYENGQLKDERKEVNGEKDGVCKTYFENGQLQYEYNFKDGKEDGKSTWYYENGQLQQELNFKDGKYEGLQVTYNEEGELTASHFYENGILIPSSYETKSSGMGSTPNALGNWLGKMKQGAENNAKYYRENGLCGTCRGTGRCHKCTKEQRVEDCNVNNNYYYDIKEGELVCPKCNGNKIHKSGFGSECSSSKNLIFCDKNDCNRGWVKCQCVKITGTYTYKGLCYTCAGTGKYNYNE